MNSEELKAYMDFVTFDNVDDFCVKVEKLAMRYEVTCDYILEEFILD